MGVSWLNGLIVVASVAVVLVMIEISERVHEAREQRVEDRARLARELEQLQAKDSGR